MGLCRGLGGSFSEVGGIIHFLLSLKQFNRSGAVLYPADQKFKVTRIMNSDGQQVNQGDLLFVVKPIKSAENAA